MPPPVLAAAKLPPLWSSSLMHQYVNDLASAKANERLRCRPAHNNCLLTLSPCCRCPGHAACLPAWPCVTRPQRQILR